MAAFLVVAVFFARLAVGLRAAAANRAAGTVTTVSAVATIGAALRYVFFTSEGDCAVTAVTCFNVNLYVINKH